MSDENCTKKCYVCKNIKLINKFHKNSSATDGMQSACKACTNQYNAAHRGTEKSKRYQVEYQSKYQKRPAAKRAHAKTQAKYRVKNLNKEKAHKAIHSAVSAGCLTKPDICGKCLSAGRIHAHHDDYSLPLVVRWLCHGCHMAWHAANGHGLNG